MALERHQMVDLLTELLECTVTELDTLQGSMIPMTKIAEKAKESAASLGATHIVISDLVEAMLTLGLENIQEQIEILHNQRLHDLRGIIYRKQEGLPIDEEDFKFLDRYYNLIEGTAPQIERDTSIRWVNLNQEIHLIANYKIYSEFYSDQLENFYELTGFHIIQY